MEISDSGISGFLRCQGWLLVRVVDFVWPAVIERGVTPPAVVEPLDVGDDITPGLRLRRVNGPVDAFVLQRREERFGHRVIPAHARAAHRGTHAQTGHQSPELGRGANAATVRVPDRVSLDSGRARRVLEGVGDELGAHVIGDRPADDFLANSSR